MTLRKSGYRAPIRCTRSMTPASVTIPYFATLSTLKLAKRIELGLLRSGQFDVAHDCPRVHFEFTVLDRRTGVIPPEAMATDVAMQQLALQKRADVMQGVQANIDGLGPSQSERIES